MTNTDGTRIFEWAKENCSITLKDGKIIYQIGELKMAYRYHRVQGINTFAEIEDKYNSVKPLVSKNHTKEQDVRPIGARSRKWERIIKVNNNKYILNNGEVDPVLFWNWYGEEYAPFIPTMKELEIVAPIVWTRKRDGTEYVKIRNGIGGGAHNSHYTFLENTLPRGLAFWITNGKQYITTHTEKELSQDKYDKWSNWGEWTRALFDMTKIGENRFFLPKAKYDPSIGHVFWPNNKEQQERWDNYHRGNITTQKENCGRELVFKRNVNHAGEHLGWELCSNSFIFEAPKVRVDKDRKAKLKEPISNFFNYICSIWGVLDCGLNEDGRANWNNYQDKQAVLQEAYVKWKNPNIDTDSIKDNYGYYWDWKGKGEFVEHLLKDEENEARVPLVELFVLDSELRQIKTGSSALSDDVAKTKVRDQFNRWINKVLELTYVYEKATIKENRV